jgi:hypothetical protein
MSDPLDEALAVLDAYMAGLVTRQDGHWGIQARSSFAS